MDTQKKMDYSRVAEAIIYIRENFQQQPTLEDIARKVNISPFHFQRMFSEWAGTTPKKFLQYTTLEYAKLLLKKGHASLPDAAYETGLSGSSRLHDLFIQIEGMTPGEYKNGGRELKINYSFAESPFGNLLIASTGKGICYLVFQDDEAQALEEMMSEFPHALFTRKLDMIQQNALFIFQNDWKEKKEIKLHLKGTRFQLKVWQLLLKIPFGQLATYGSIAKQLNSPGASRAVGSAIGSNPVCFLIPCHRVLRASGMPGGYRWGIDRKIAMIGWEAAKIDNGY